MELHRHNHDVDVSVFYLDICYSSIIFQDHDRHVVVWPPNNDRQPHRSASAMARSITDPDRIEGFRRQKELEMAAIQRREEQLMQVCVCDA